MVFPEPISLAFAAWFRGWNRLEARSRTDDPAPALSARTADPLWALARQWQLLELKGEDAGTPIVAKLLHETATPDAIQLGTQPFEMLNGIPVEVLVEQEQVPWDWRLRVRAGQQYERLARLYDLPNAASVINDARTRFAIEFPLPNDIEWRRLDLASRRFVSLMAGRAINGESLFKAITDDGFQSSISARWMSWWERLYSQTQNRAPLAWQPPRLDYEFRLQQASSASAPLHASSYRTGTVDWHTFVAERAPAASFAPQPPLRLTPVHARYAGQPMRRWWEFEDRAMDFGALDVAKTDLGKLALMHFGIMGADDWFVLPLESTPNNLLRVSSLTVTDCFGLTASIEPAVQISPNALEVWQVFALASGERNGQPADFLYLPPMSGVREESPVIEELRLTRDEGANAVFAIESTVPDQIGEPVSGLAAHLEYLRRAPSSNGTAEGSPDSESPSSEAGTPRSSPGLKYVLTTKVPTNWIPYLATDELNVVAGLPQRSVKLRRGNMVATDVPEGAAAIAPLSRLLQDLTVVHEEAVGRAGVRIELRKQRMRSASGRTFVWLGRRIGMGKGESRSGLRFDAVESTNLSGQL